MTRETGSTRTPELRPTPVPASHFRHRLPGVVVSLLLALHPSSSQTQHEDPAFDPFSDRDAVADDDQLFLDEQAVVSGIDDEIQDFPADDFDEDQRLIA